MLDLTKQIALAFPCAGNPSNPFALRTVLTSPGGYSTFFSATLKPMYDLGFRIFMLQRPHGEYAIGDQYQDISSSYYLGLSEQSYVITDLETALDWAAINMPEAEFMMYLGTHGFDMQADLAEGRLELHAQKLDAAVASFLPYENVHIMFDQMTTLNSDHPMALFVQDLRDEFEGGNSEHLTGEVIGRQVITEPSPNITDETKDWLYDMPSVMSAGLVIKRTVLPQFRQSGGSVFHCEWYQLNDRNWDDVPRPEIYDYLRWAIRRNNFMPIIYENAIPLLQGKTQTQVRNRALRGNKKPLRRGVPTILKNRFPPKPK